MQTSTILDAYKANFDCVPLITTADRLPIEYSGGEVRFWGPIEAPNQGMAFENSYSRASTRWRSIAAILMYQSESPMTESYTTGVFEMRVG